MEMITDPEEIFLSKDSALEGRLTQLGRIFAEATAEGNATLVDAITKEALELKRRGVLLDEFLVRYVTYCVLIKVSKGNNGSVEARERAAGMAAIALDELRRAHQACREAGILLEELRCGMKRTVPEYAATALL